MQVTLLWLAVALYAISIALILPSVMRRRPSLEPRSLVALGVGLLLHAGAFALPALESHRLPVTDVRTALSLFAFLVTGSFFLAYLRYRITALGLFMLPLVFVLTLTAAIHPGGLGNPAVHGWVARIHIASIILGYAALFLTFVAALMYLIQERELKSKRLDAFYYRLPSLEVCDEIYYKSLLFGLPFLSLGILTGFVWASRAWKGPWELDPKILASLITWVIYLILFSTRLSGNWRGRRGAYVAIIAFAAVLFTFIGVSSLSGQHGFVPKGMGPP
jgi:ABC-type uncharacterized transport system permease subunit